MWIFSKYGAYSIVKKDDAYHVRARVPEDLKRLARAAQVHAEVRYWKTADYKYRMTVDARELARIMSALGNGVDYPNFKAKIAATKSQRAKLGIYHEIWYLLQSKFDPISSVKWYGGEGDGADDSLDYAPEL